VNQIKIVLFDLGNVIAHIDFDAFWRSLGFLTPAASTPWKEEYAFWTRQYETGRIASIEYLAGLAKVFNGRFTTEQLEEAVDSIIQEPVEGMLELVQQVSRDHQTALVSNTSETHYHLSLKRFEVLRMLQKHYLSFRLQVMKPDRRFYEAIIQDMQTDPAAMLFIDDLESNVEGARLVGMHTVRFEGIEKLKNSLKLIL
jgi:HAD superfamily hydrolase (TIGR01509 family)